VLIFFHGKDFAEINSIRIRESLSIYKKEVKLVFREKKVNPSEIYNL